MPQSVIELVDLLDLEEIEVGLFRGRQPKTALQRVFGGTAYKARFNATYVSPGKVRTSQALAIGLTTVNGEGGGAGGTGGGACLVIFETLAGRG